MTRCRWEEHSLHMAAVRIAWPVHIQLSGLPDKPAPPSAKSREVARPNQSIPACIEAWRVIPRAASVSLSSRRFFLCFPVDQAHGMSGVSERLGYASHGGLSGVERFMKRYFLIAKDVGDLTAIVCAALEAQHTKPTPMLDRFVQRFRRKSHAIAQSKDFVIENERITVARKDVFASDPVNLVRLFHFAAILNRAIHPDATRLVTQSLRLADAKLRSDAEANRLFVEILISKGAPEIVLRRMNEAGLLGRFIPEFGRVVAMMQFNMYHHYTVDEHLIRSIGALTEIEAGRHADELPVAHEIMPMIRNRRILYVALFLHDVAKGRPEDHSIAGAKVAMKVCPRLGLNEVETEAVAWLIEHHLDMSTVAQSRDLSDPSTIEAFAGILRSTASKGCNGRRMNYAVPCRIGLIRNSMPMWRGTIRPIG